MSQQDDDPIQPKPCPNCAKTDQVTAATDHERDRTGCAWWAACCRLAFTGSASEFQHMQAKRIADEAERMTTRPEPDGGNR